MPELNRLAPDFELTSLRGESQRLSRYRGKIVIINFWSCECPHSERADAAILSCLARWGAQAVMLSVAANRSESLEAWQKAAETRALPEVLIDAGQVVADMYEAQTTPHVFIVDRAGVLRYRGAVDDVTFRQRTMTRFYVEEVVDALLNGDAPPLSETPAYGCAIIREI